MLLQRIANRGLRPGEIFERAAARHPGNIVMLDRVLDIAPRRGTRMLVTEVAELVDEFATRLWKAGVRPSERVAIYKSDNVDITLLACSVSRIGAVPVLLSPALSGATVTALLHRLERAYLLTDQAKLEGELAAHPVGAIAARVLLAAGSHPAGATLEEFAAAPRLTPVPMPLHHPTLITHTSGTTGLPKLAVHTPHSLQARYRPQAIMAAGVRTRETTVIHVSFVHSRLFTALTIALLRGFPLLLLSDPDPVKVGDVFAALRPGFLETHPNSFIDWEVLADDPREPLANVKYFSSTFDAIHPRTMRRLLHASRRRSPMYVQLYGQSEVGPVAGRTYTRRRALEADGRCVGMPFPGMTNVRVVARNGLRPAPDTPGYIEIQSDGRAITYLGEQERYDQQVTDGWWRMGDVGYRSPWGCLHLLDREVDVIPSVGSTLALEDRLLSRLPELTEVVIIPGGQDTAVPVVCTRNDRPLDQERWRKAIADLRPMADPVQWRIDQLPRTATSKVKRIELAARMTGKGTPEHR